jgi:hypothetical protein
MVLSDQCGCAMIARPPQARTASMPACGPSSYIRRGSTFAVMPKPTMCTTSAGQVKSSSIPVKSSIPFSTRFWESSRGGDR